MKHTILEPDYEERFVDIKKYPASTLFYLRGMAAAIQDSHNAWRPLFSELIKLLRDVPNNQILVRAGSAYGAAKQIITAYPGPKLLMFGAAVNALGTVDTTEMDRQIDSAIEKIRKASIAEDVEVSVLIHAAKERAKMGRISEMMRREFADGLIRTGKYDEKRAQDTAKKIVDTTHDVRHRGLIELIGWSRVEPFGNHYFIDINSIPEESWSKYFFDEQKYNLDMIVGKSYLQGLITPAREACAQVILKYVEPLRQSQ